MRAIFKATIYTDKGSIPGQMVEFSSGNGSTIKCMGKES